MLGAVKHKKEIEIDNTGGDYSDLINFSSLKVRVYRLHQS